MCIRDRYSTLTSTNTITSARIRSTTEEDVDKRQALMLPYVLTVLALCVFSRNAKDPAALGVPYDKSH